MLLGFLAVFVILFLRQHLEIHLHEKNNEKSFNNEYTLAIKDNSKQGTLTHI